MANKSQYRTKQMTEILSYLQSKQGSHVTVHDIQPTGVQHYQPSQVSHLAELIQKGTGLKVNVSDNPITSVALGLSKIIKDDNLKTVAYSIEGMNK